MPSKTISILLPDLRGGGAERMHVLLEREFTAKGYMVNFVLMRKTGELLQELVPEAMVHDLKTAKLRTLLMPLIRFLKAERPDALLVAMWPLTTIAIWAVKLSRVPTRIVISDHNPMSIKPEAKGIFGTFPMRLTMQISYPFADAVVCVSNGVGEDIAKLARMSTDNLNVIYNPAARGELPENQLSDETISPWLKADHRVITVGSFKKQKNHSLLINCFAEVVKSKNATLLILGEGRLRPELEKLIKQLGLEQKILMPGFTQDPYPYYLAADLFVLSSEYEGFGNVIVEAMECGLPIVSTDCQSGPREILEDGKYGKLVPVGDTNALASAMLTSLDEMPNPERQKERARYFSVEKAAISYLKLLDPENNPAV